MMFHGKMKIWCFFFLYALAGFSYSQNIDSLMKLEKKSSGLKNAVVNNEIGLYFYNEGEYDKAISHNKKAFYISDSLKNDKILSDVYALFGDIYYDLNQFNTSVYYFQKAVHYKQKIKDMVSVSYCYNVLGILYRKLGQFDLALENAQNSLTVAQEINNTTRTGYAYSNIGHIYISLRQFEKALEFYKRSAEYAVFDKDKDDEADAYINIGIAYYELKNHEKSFEYTQKALDLSNETGNKAGQARALNNLANRYIEQGKYDLAMDYHLQGLKIELESGNPGGAAYSYANIAEIFREKKDFTTCLIYKDSALKITIEKDLKLNIYDSLTYIYEEMGDPVNALYYHRLYSAMKDSIINEKNNKAIAELATIYNIEKTEKENELLKKDRTLQDLAIKRQRIITFSVLGGLALLAVFAVFLLRSNRMRKRANRILYTQKEEISTQRDEIEKQRDQVTEQKSFIEKQKQDIEDSIRYAKRIQNAVLPSENLEQIVRNEHFVVFYPKDVVSGDFYWANIIGDWQIFCVSDCTGHGVPGAFMSMLGVSFLNEIVRNKEVTNSADVLNHMRKSVIDALKQTGESGTQKDGMDMSLVAIHRETKKCSVAGANNPVYIIRKTDKPEDHCNYIRNGFELIEIPADKMPLGIYIRMDDFTNHDIQLQKGDKIYLFSDGYPDQFGGPKGMKFKYSAFKNLLLDTAGQPMVEQGDILKKSLHEWMNNGGKEYHQIDDITVMGVMV